MAALLLAILMLFDAVASALRQHLSPKHAGHNEVAVGLGAKHLVSRTHSVCPNLTVQNALGLEIDFCQSLYCLLVQLFLGYQGFV